jgi:methionyl-tRNA formyltransferase
VVCGKGRIATAGLSFAVHYAAAHRLTFKIAAAATRDDKGFDTWQPSLIRAAMELGVPLVDLATLYSERGLLLVSLEYDQIIPVGRFSSSRLYNIHFSALPKYRGVFTSIWPLLNDERSVGVTLHRMDPGVDTGAIVAQRLAPVPEYMTARQLYDVYMNEGLALFREWFPQLVATIPAEVDQDDTQATAYNRRSLDVRLVEVDLTGDAETVCRFVRAFTFPEYQLPTVRGRGVRGCFSIPGTTDELPGTAIHATAYSSSFAVANGGIVEVLWA